MHEAKVKYQAQSELETFTMQVKEYQHGYSTAPDTLIDYEKFITEDDEPVDNLYSERQQRLLTDTLYTSWAYDRPFVACANVGIYENPPDVPIVPDMFLSLNVILPEDIWTKRNRCYFIGIYGKPPELVIEIVFNKVGNERDAKLRKYERMNIKYYIIFDPELHIFNTSLHAYQLLHGRYQAYHRKNIQKKGVWFPDLKLGLKVHRAMYQGFDTEWLLWFDQNGQILLSGEEKARIEFMRAEEAVKRANKLDQCVDIITKRAEAAIRKADEEAHRANEEARRVQEAEKQVEQERKRAEAALKELAVLKAKLSHN